jgi:hypothetical protein
VPLPQSALHVAPGSVVAGEDHERAVREPLLVEGVEQSATVVVEFLHRVAIESSV